MHTELYNLPIERMLLSTVFEAFEPARIDALMGEMDAGIFYLPSHRDVYEAMAVLYRTGRPIDLEFVKEELFQSKKLDEVVLLEIINANPVHGFEPYIRQLGELSKKRRLLAMSTQIQSMLCEAFASADEVQAFLDAEMVHLEERTGCTMPVTMAQAIDAYDAMEEPPKIMTGIRKIDAMLCGGIEPAQLVHVGGEKNVGKTTLLKQILFNTSSGFDSLFFSFEMPRWKMAKLTKRLKGACDLNRYRIIDTEMMRSRDVMDVARMIRMMWRKYGIRFVLIDSKMKLTHKSFKGHSDSDRKGDIDAVLNAVVQETGIVLMMITQLKKEDIERGTMSNYGSGLSDYEADMQIMLYRSKGTHDAVEVKVTKNRQDVLHEPVKLWLDHEEMKFTDIQVETVAYEHGDGLREGRMDVFELPEIL